MKKISLVTAVFTIAWFFANAQTYTWKGVRVGGCGAVTSMNAHPLVQNLYFITTDVGNPYRWNNTTQSWEGLLNSVSASNWNVGACANIAFAPGDSTGNILYATVDKYPETWASIGKVIKSTNRGTTWTDANLSIWVGANYDQKCGEGIAVDPKNSNVVYVTTRQDGTYKSINAGSSWSKINFLNGEFVAFDVSAGVIGAITKNIYIGTAADVSRSTNGGSSFSLVSGSPINVHKAAIHKNGTMYVTAETGVFKWNGASWLNISPATNTVYLGIDVNPANNNQVIVNQHAYSLGNNQVYTSTNGGVNWKNITDSMTNDFMEVPFKPESQFASSIFDFCWDPFNANKVFFTDWYNVFQTNNILASQVSWKVRASGHEEIVTTGVLSCPPFGANSLLSCTADVGGFQHTSATSPPTASLVALLPYMDNGSGVAFSENNTNFIARVGSNGWDGAGVGGYSTNGGVSFTAFPNLPGSRGRIAISASSETMLWSTQSGFTYRSANRGSQWTKINTIPKSIIGGSDVFVYANPLASDKVNGNKFYTYNAGKIYVSTNGGASFTVKASALPILDNTDYIRLETSPGKEGDIWLGLNGSGLYHSTNSGTSFTKVTNVQVATLVALGRPACSIPAVYVFGTVNNIADGVFRSDDNCATWVQINTAAYRMGMEPNSMAADRITYGKLYIGTNGNGIYVGEPSVPYTTPPGCIAPVIAPPLKQTNFLVYPNPINKNELLKIVPENPDERYNTTVYDECGQLVYKSLNNTSEINVSIVKWLPGMYVIKILTEKSSFTSKIVIR